MAKLQIVSDIEGTAENLISVIETGTVLDMLYIISTGEINAKVSATVTDDAGEIIRESE